MDRCIAPRVRPIESVCAMTFVTVVLFLVLCVRSQRPACDSFAEEVVRWATSFREKGRTFFRSPRHRTATPPVRNLVFTTKIQNTVTLSRAHSRGYVVAQKNAVDKMMSASIASGRCVAFRADPPLVRIITDTGEEENPMQSTLAYRKR